MSAGAPGGRARERQFVQVLWTAFLGSLALGILSRQASEFVPFAVAAAVLLHLHRPAVWPFEAAGGSPC